MLLKTQKHNIHWQVTDYNDKDKTIFRYVQYICPWNRSYRRYHNIFFKCWKRYATFERNAFYNQNLSFTQPPRHRGSANTLMNSYATVIYVKHFIHCVMTSVGNLLYIVLEDRSYCHFRGEISIRCLADIFFPKGLIQLQEWYDPVWYIWHDLATAKVPQDTRITPENWLFVFINGDSSQSGRKKYFSEKPVAEKLQDDTKKRTRMTF